MSNVVDFIDNHDLSLTDNYNYIQTIIDKQSNIDLIIHKWGRKKIIWFFSNKNNIF